MLLHSTAIYIRTLVIIKAVRQRGFNNKFASGQNERIRAIVLPVNAPTEARREYPIKN